MKTNLKPYIWHENNTIFHQWSERDRACVRINDQKLTLLEKELEGWLVNSATYDSMKIQNGNSADVALECLSLNYKTKETV